MRRILKFPVPVPGVAEVVTADQPEFLSVAWQGEQLCVWALATVGTEVRTRLVAVPTGAMPPDNAVFVGTAQHPTMLNGAPFVLHVFREAL